MSTYKYYAITLVPRELDEAGNKIGYGTPKIDVVEIPCEPTQRIVCIPETNYGYGTFPIDADFQLSFAQLRVAQVGLLLDKYKTCVDKLFAEPAVELLEESHTLCDMVGELLKLDCASPDFNTVPVRAAEAPTGLADNVEKRITAHQTWEKNELGGISPSGWLLEDGSELPENASLVSIVETKEHGDADLPITAIFKVSA